MERPSTTETLTSEVPGGPPPILLPVIDIVRHGSLGYDLMIGRRRLARVFGQTPEAALANARALTAINDLILAARFAASVIQSQGMFDLSERMAYEKLLAALRKAEGKME